MVRITQRSINMAAFQKPKYNIPVMVYIDYDLRQIIIEKMKKSGKIRIGETFRYYLIKGILCEQNHETQEKTP